MAREERYDVVIIGAGHNGTTTAAYLAKCGLSVCVLEERTEYLAIPVHGANPTVSAAYAKVGDSEITGTIN